MDKEQELDFDAVLADLNRQAHDKELEALACDVNIEKMTMFMKEIPELSMSDMEQLEVFIEWKE